MELLRSVLYCYWFTFKIPCKKLSKHFFSRILQLTKTIFCTRIITLVSRGRFICQIPRTRLFKAHLYCIEGISETPNASADFYCQSNTNNLTRTSCAFYEESLQVNHRLYTQKERARYCEMGREGERRDGVRIQRGFNRG